MESEKDTAIILSSCANLKTSQIIIASEGQEWRPTTRYETSVYLQNLTSFTNNYPDSGSKGVALTIIHNMGSVNRELDRTMDAMITIQIALGEPQAKMFLKTKNSEAAKISADIFAALEKLGYTVQKCSNIATLN